jgi:anti-sigma factor RsiW
MTCAECQDLLSPLIDRELSASELAFVRTHLHTCAECARVCVELLCIDASSPRVADCPAPPPDLWGRVEAGIAERRPPRSTSDRDRAEGATILDFTSARMRISRVGRK